MNQSPSAMTCWVTWASLWLLNICITHIGLWGGSPWAEGPVAYMQWAKVWLGLCDLSVDGFHPDTATVFQFHGCLFHGHDCHKFKDTWLHTTARERRECTEQVEPYLRVTCEWESLKRTNPSAATVIHWQADVVSSTVANAWFPSAPRTNMQALLGAIWEDHVFSLTLVDIHTPDGLKDKFRHQLPILKSAALSKEEAGPHMAWFCEATHVVSRSWVSLISSYFGCWMLIPMPLLHWYLLNGLVITRLYLRMQYDRRQCFQSLAKDCAQKQWNVQRDQSQALASEATNDQCVH